MIYRDLIDTSDLIRYATALNARARAAGAGGTLTVEALRDRILAAAGCCEWCGRGLLSSEFELDHVVSLRVGGANRAGNLVLACPDCNRRKGQKHPARFAAEIYGETGQLTRLVALLFQRFDMPAARQMSFFGAEAADLDQDWNAAPANPWAE